MLRRALALVADHPAVSDVGAPSFYAASGTFCVDVTFDVNLPSEWRQSGVSPSGVNLKETVRFDFPAEFPLISPDLSLRPDFNRKLAHMMPWLTDRRPVPCIFEGSLDELLHHQGLLGIVNQMAVWLEHAALGNLIDPNQGWEPVRRDSFKDYLIADADALRSVANRTGGHKFYKLAYLRTTLDGQLDIIHGQISTETAKFRQQTVSQFFKKIPLDAGSRYRNDKSVAGKSVALVVWPGKHPSGQPIINDTYLPETVTTVTELKERAKLYGCVTELLDGLAWLRKCLSVHPKDGPFSLAVVLLARRPFNLIGTDSPIELCPYFVDIHSPDLFFNDDAAQVRPAVHRSAITRSLLARMAGNTPTSDRPRWTLLGAGSLGSKLAVHLARAGNGPEVVVDKSAMTPHNAARHALLPMTNDMQLLWMDAKAHVLCGSLRGLGQEPRPMVANAIRVLRSQRQARQAWPKSSWAVVNTTASLVVREALAATDLLPTRVIETSLFAGGRVGLITVEGPDRNPNTNDLMAECYALLSEDKTLATVVFDRNNMSRQQTGQGCGSLTMTMSDGRLSLFAAGMAEYLLAAQRDRLAPETGEILIGQLSKDGLGLSWRITKVAPTLFTTVTMGKEIWRIHVHQRAKTKIDQETARWPNTETGGVLMGRVSEASRTIRVVDVLDPPPDSTRSSAKFVLGTEGLWQQMNEYSEAVDWSLYCLGTWHSHLSSSGPSTTDLATAKTVSRERLTPFVFLINTPAGLCSYLEDLEDCDTKAG